MHYYNIAPNRIIRTDSQFFTYCSTKKLKIGQIVEIEVGKKTLIGIVFDEVKKPQYKTKSVVSIIENNPLPKPLIDVAVWIAQYYGTPLATVLQTIIPKNINKKRRLTLSAPEYPQRKRTKKVFNKDQLAAIKTLDKYTDGTFLLQGVTGSGKTEVYIDLAKKALQSGRSAIILVPEITLMPQLVAELSNHFSNPLTIHSRMTEASRHIIWQKALNSDTPQIAIGPRSALFLPLKNIGLIVVDESHDASFKQEKAPRYSALRTATILGQLHHAKVIFGSATPNATDKFLALESKRPILLLKNVAQKNNKPPEITLVDATKRNNFKKHRFLSDKLLIQIEQNLKNKKQTLIFHNRRGSTSMTLCEKCGWSPQCPRCFLPLSLHISDFSMHCHLCGWNQKVPMNCPECSSSDIIHKGIGTQLIEAELQKIFPEAHIARFDRDNTKADSLEALYQKVYDGKIDIIVGTQIIAKGLDLPNLTTVGIVQADTGLIIPDFNTDERVFQLLTQAVGRVGRNKNKSQVIVQTYKPNHPSIVYGIAQDYDKFYQYTIDQRKRGLFPPFVFLLKLTCVYKTEAAAIKNSQKIFQDLKNKVSTSVKISHPAPAFYEKQAGNYRWQIIVKSPKRQLLVDLLQYIPSKNWQHELDPTSLL